MLYYSRNSITSETALKRVVNTLLSYPARKRFISTKPTACRSISWSMRPMTLGIQFDMEGFERARAEEQARARASWKGGSKAICQPGISGTAEDGIRRLSSTRIDQL